MNLAAGVSQLLSTSTTRYGASALAWHVASSMACFSVGAAAYMRSQRNVAEFVSPHASWSMTASASAGTTAGVAAAAVVVVVVMPWRGGSREVLNRSVRGNNRGNEKGEWLGVSSFNQGGLFGVLGRRGYDPKLNLRDHAEAVRPA